MSNIFLPAMGVAVGYFVGHTIAAGVRLMQPDMANLNRTLYKDPACREEFNRRFTVDVLSQSTALGCLCGAIKALRISQHRLAMALSLTSMFACGVSYLITRDREKNLSKQFVITLSQEEVVAGVSLGILTGLGVSYLQR